MSYLLFSDFTKRAEERGMPVDRKTWIRYEQKGIVEFRTLPTGRRIFKDIAEIDSILNKFEKQ
jgi:hypothetical protein